MNRIWFPGQIHKVKNNVNYFLQVGSNSKNGLKFQEVSWWTKKLPLDGGHLPAPPSPKCGMGKEGVTVDGRELADSSNLLDEIIRKTGPSVLVVGGHYYPNPKDNAFVGEITLKLFTEGLDLINKLIKSGKKVDLSFFVNDIHLNGDERESLYENYLIPEKMRKLIISCEVIRRQCRVLVFSQRRLSNMFVKEKGGFYQNGFVTRGKNGSDYLINLDGVDMTLISSQESEGSGYMRCVQTCTKILNMAQILQYNGVVQLYPVCGRSPVETARLVAKKLYDYRIPTINIYKTKSCWN